MTPRRRQGMPSNEEWMKLNDDLQSAKRKRDEARLVYKTYAIEQEPWTLPPLTDEELEEAMAYASKLKETDE